MRSVAAVDALDECLAVVTQFAAWAYVSKPSQILGSGGALLYVALVLLCLYWQGVLVVMTLGRSPILYLSESKSLCIAGCDVVLALLVLLPPVGVGVRCLLAVLLALFCALHGLRLSALT